jgi:predicted permease
MGHQIRPVAVAGPEGEQPTSAEFVTARYFSVLGSTPRLGRDFGSTEDHAGPPPVAIISDRYWRRAFHADTAALGRTLTIDNTAFTIVGIAPRGFVGAFPGVDTDLWLPAGLAGLGEAESARGEAASVMLVGRLKAGASRESASAELHALTRRLRDANPARDPDRTFVLGSARGAHPLLARLAGTFLMMQMAIVAVVLLVACANVASLLLARASARHAELATRLALGAGRLRLIGQLLMESLLLAAVGGGAGLLLSYGALALLNGYSPTSGPTGGPIFLNLAVDHRVLWFTAVMTAVTTIGFGLVPAIKASRVDLISLVKDSGATVGRQRSRLRSGLLVVQVALSCVLLIAAGLLVRSLHRVGGIDPGFDPDRVVIATLNLQSLGYDASRAAALFEEVLVRSRALAATERAALADFVPMGPRGSAVTIEVPRPAGRDRSQVPYNRISDGYFQTMDQPLRQGRDFAASDSATSAPVAIVNDAFARRHWPEATAIGRRVRVDGEAADREIVGVAADARYASFGGEVQPFIYLPWRQRPGSQLTLHVRTNHAPPAAIAGLRRLVGEVDSKVRLERPQTLRDGMGFSLVPARIARAVFTIAGTIGALLAAGGLYGLVCYTLALRLREIGIRIALGATRHDVFRLVVGGAVRLTIAGVVTGAALSALGARLLASMLFGVSPFDPMTFGSIGVLLLMVALTAGYVAARRGLNVSPATTLRGLSSS